jgi:hypothetical protein
LETIQNFEVGCGNRIPELDSISPDRFQDGFVEQDFVVEGELLLAAKQPMHLGEG